MWPKRYLEDEFSLWDREYRDRIMRSAQMESAQKRWYANKYRKTKNKITLLINKGADIFFGLLFLLVKHPLVQQQILLFFIDLRNSFCKWLSKKIGHMLNENPDSSLSLQLLNWQNPNYNATEPRLLADKLRSLNVMNIYTSQAEYEMINEIYLHATKGIDKCISNLVQLLIKDHGPANDTVAAFKLQKEFKIKIEKYKRTKKKIITRLYLNNSYYIVIKNQIEQI